MTSTAQTEHQAALEYLGRGDPDSALAAIEKSLAADYSWAASHATHGLVLASKGDRDAADRAVSAALKLDPQLPYAHFARGVLVQDENPDQAVIDFKRALRDDPENPRFLLQLGVSHLKAGDRDAAAPQLLAALEKDPNNTTTLVLLADIALANNDRAEASQLADRILEIEPHHRDALQVRAQLALLEGNGQVLSRCAATLLAVEPDNKRALDLAALGSLSHSYIWRPWWLILRWRAFSEAKQVTLWALVVLGAILGFSFVLVTAAPDFAVAFHGVLWLLFGYLLAAHIVLRRRVRRIKTRARQAGPARPHDAPHDAPPGEPKPAKGRAAPNRTIVSGKGKLPTVH